MSAPIGDRWFMRNGESAKGLTLAVKRFGVEPGTEPTAANALDGFVTKNSRWTSAEALRANARRRASGVLVSADDIHGGIRTRRHFAADAGCPAFDLITEETLS